MTAAMHDSPRTGKREAARRAVSRLQTLNDSDDEDEIIRTQSRSERYARGRTSRIIADDSDADDSDADDSDANSNDDRHPETAVMDDESYEVVPHGNRLRNTHESINSVPKDELSDLDDELSNVVGPGPIAGDKRKPPVDPAKRSTRSRVVSYREDAEELSDHADGLRERPNGRVRIHHRVTGGPAAHYTPQTSEDEDEGQLGELKEEAEQLREDAEKMVDDRYPLRHRRSEGFSGLPNGDTNRIRRLSKRGSQPRARFFPAAQPPDNAWTGDGLSSDDSSDDALPDTSFAAVAAGGAPPVSFNKRRYAGPSKDRRIDLMDYKAAGAMKKQVNSIEPIKVDLDLDWNSIGGLDSHVRALKEMVSLPLMYPEVFEKFSLEAPKGVLFYGPPGTGKTLCARALAASCGAEQEKNDSKSTGDDRPRKPRVSFFMRNGADCLSKWVGEAERQLRQTFEAAKAHQPSIIFFDEIDGLAPVRSSRQDQVHSSIVSTLLGLMDGLEARGRIVVIGATNRVDAIDPALRRAGRFDRELIFTLPNLHARQRILEIHTKKWDPKPTPHGLTEIAKRTVGYCGADIKSLCSEAALRAFRRRYPQVYDSNEKLLINKDEVNVGPADFMEAMKSIVPASHRSARVSARPVPSAVGPVLNPVRDSLIATLNHIFEQGTVGLKAKSAPVQDVHLPMPNGKEIKLDGLWQLMETPSHRPRMLISGKPGMGQLYLGPAVLHALEGCTAFTIDMPTLHAEPSARCPEEVLVNAFREASRAAPSIIYLPHLNVWWATASPTLQATLTVTLRDLPPTLPVLVLATAESETELPSELLSEFPDPIHLTLPTANMRLDMFKPLSELINVTLAKGDSVPEATEVLPVAPAVSQNEPPPSEVEAKIKVEEIQIRRLRMEMADFFDRLRRNRKYKVFSEPVDPTVAPDYYDIIKNPMDLHTIMGNIVERRYGTVIQVVSDVDLMVKNAIDYNPAHTEEGATILYRAHQLIDDVHEWADLLDENLVSSTNNIYTRRTTVAEAAAQAVANVSTVTQVETETEAEKAPAESIKSAPKEILSLNLSHSERPVSSDNANGNKRESKAAGGNSPMDTSPVKVNDLATRSERTNPASSASGFESKRIIPEIDSVRLDLATDSAIMRLSEQWSKATEQYCVEALEAAYNLILSLLHEKRYDRDRSLVCTMISELMDEMDSEPAILRFTEATSR